jgi:hypothetical protein
MWTVCGIVIRPRRDENETRFWRCEPSFFGGAVWRGLLHTGVVSFVFLPVCLELENLHF